MAATKHPVTRHPMGIHGCYKYRGVTIERDDSNRGYWGHWTARVGSIMAGTHQKLTTQTRANLLKQIDEHLDKTQTA